MPIGTRRPGEPPSDGDEVRERLLDLARRQGLAFADVERIQIDRDAFNAIPHELQNEFNILPVRLDGQTLYVTMGENSSEVCRQLAHFTGLRIVPCLALPDRIAESRRRVASAQ